MNTETETRGRTLGHTLRVALLAGAGLGAFALTAPAQAQEDGASAEETQAIVITGSRIVRRDYESTSPVVTVDQELFKNSSTAALEQSLNKLPQFVPAQTPTAGGDIQPTATNTPGAATISLRGIGANRNLVLIDGRRATPSNASMVVDISTIPSAAIERTEVISGGASATYGADAVAGVTNFILKRNFVGVQLDGQMGITERGDNREWQVSGIVGAELDGGRGNVSLAMSINSRGANYQRDRKWYRDLFNDPNINGTAFFNPAPGYIIDFANAPSGAVLDSIFNAVPAGQPTASQALASFGLGTVYTNPDGSVFSGTSFATRGLAYRFNRDEPGWKETAVGNLGYNNTNLYLILPLTRYNAIARGNYEINDWLGVFGQALVSHVTTYTRNEPGPITTGWDVFVPQGNGVYTGDASRGIVSSLNGDGTTNAAYLAGGRYGLNCPATGGCTVSQVFPTSPELQQILASRPNPNAPFKLTSYMPDDRETFTDVFTYTLIAGFEGKIPGTDWTWETFVNHGVSDTSARQTGIYSLERLRAVMTSPNYGYGFSQKGNAASGGFGASTGACSTGLNFFSPPAGGFSEDCLEAVRADLKNRSTMKQTVAEANFQGSLIALPAGNLQAALGASYRRNSYQFLNDTLTTQGSSFLDQALGIYPSGDAFGKISAKEVYGELLIPVLKDIPGIKSLSFELGGRISDYNTTGTSYTYKALADWALTDWFRIRGGFNRAERAPNIGELFLSAQQSFGVDNRGDQCSRLNPSPFSANPDKNARGAAGAAQVEAVCRVLMAQSGNPDAADTYYAAVQSAAGSGFAFPTLIGNPNLTPEKANTWTVGAVIRSPFNSPALQRLSLTVDFYDIKIKDAIGAQTIGAVSQQCFDPAFNPLVLTDATAAANSQFCQLLPRTQTGNTGNTFITYSNAGRVHLQGIDAQLDWSTPVGPGTLFLNALVNYQLTFKSSPLSALPLVDYVGTLGTVENGLNQGAYEYRIFATLGYAIGGARLALQWQHLPAVEDGGEVTTPGGTPNTAGYPAYDIFNLSGSYSVTKDISLRFGIDNLFDKAPPLGSYNPNANAAIGQVRGGSFNSTFYDTNGRRFFIGASMKF